MNESQDASAKAVLICGLGLWGQHCALVLKELGIPVYGLHDAQPTSWEVQAIPQALDRFTIGDCRRHSALLPQLLFRHHARRLAREPGLIGVTAEVVPALPAAGAGTPILRLGQTRVAVSRTRRQPSRRDQQATATLARTQQDTPARVLS